MTATTEPETVVYIISSFTASFLAANTSGDIVHAEADWWSCWLGGNVRPARNAGKPSRNFFLPTAFAAAFNHARIYLTSNWTARVQWVNQVFKLK